MRVKKQKRHRKVVRFYSACFSFREPYKVLCDGTFIHHLLAHNLTPADDVLARLLGARALLFTTRCIIGELRSLGESHAETLEASQQLITARCDHEKRVSALACIGSVIGETNSEHFFVATLDADVRKKFREVAGVPVIYGLKNSLFIEQPSSKQREFVKSSEEKRLHMNESDYLKLHKKDLKKKMSNSVNADGTEESHFPGNISTRKRMLGIAEKSKFKRKGAKGPNPLSCKKKKNKENNLVAKIQVKCEKQVIVEKIKKKPCAGPCIPCLDFGDGADVGATKKKRVRKRKRSKVSKQDTPSS